MTNSAGGGAARSNSIHCHLMTLPIIAQWAGEKATVSGTADLSEKNWTRRLPDLQKGQQVDTDEPALVSAKS